MPLRLSRRSKYGAVKTTVDGLTFDSKAEARRFGELKLLERVGEIESLEIHPRYPLVTEFSTGTLAGAAKSLNGERPLVGFYEADFAYRDKFGVRVTEDVKGLVTPLANWKLRHFKAQYGYAVTIVRMR